jgi:hypothetical protein
MNDHPGELNAFTMGGANNWVYGVQYLSYLRSLAGSNCFSPDPSTFEEEKRIYEKELPEFARFLSTFDSKMRQYLHDAGFTILTGGSLDDWNVTPAPIGRQGAHCNNSALSELPNFPLNVPFHGASDPF